MALVKSSIEYDRVFEILWGENFKEDQRYKDWRRGVEANPRRPMYMHLADLWDRVHDLKPSSADTSSRPGGW